MNTNSGNGKDIYLFIYLFYLLQPSWKDPINSDTASGKTATSS